MIRDYNFGKQSLRRKRHGLPRIILGVAVLGLTVGAVRHFDLQAPSFERAADSPTAETLSLPLALPQQTTHTIGATRDDRVDRERQASAEQVVRHQEPALPATAVIEAPSFLVPAFGTGASLRAEPASPFLKTGLGAPTETSADDDTDVAVIAPIEEVPGAEPAARVQPQTLWVEHTIAKGESLARIFAAQEIEARVLHRIVNSSEQAQTLARIRPGQKLRFAFDENRELTKLELHRNRVESLRIAISDDEVRVDEISKDVEKRVASASGQIESSLFVDGQKAGLSDGQIMDMATIFGWDIDFALEIRAGDQFRVLFEEHFLDGEKLRDGPILAAEFTNRGTTYRAIRYEDSNGETGYYDADGQSKRRAFIRTPIRFARVSSRYNPRRWHPVLKKWRSHKGVDYAAPTGTPVKATGDGRVIFRGTKGGYGKTVIIEHANKYTTLYAHLSGYSKRSSKGNRLKQGQVIGYVGKTGLATGPHLHYEFRVHGQHRDPLRVKLPKSLSLPKSEIGKFRAAAEPLLAQLESIPATLVASADPSQAR